ncbi:MULTISPECIES: methyl-accepting chemotaxis protein [Halomonas]|uniref:Methyl-accepting chemotaxis sensory transducer n=1 Tax=Halomonas halophila TaxID=29573 RepID=A0ABQ0U7L7_9GAMM|nr:MULTISPECIES: methyl-accepting chemotaxis protein [Halomonas]MDR5889382.1 nitrate- and nitrite sensing domain-containing protein [Halomonas salina]WJY06068.1 nitrate- and nitrite sensing domain-containing protein [Halomonas halophila]GEK74491.1 methyl-accepting chemotaxis sensory transducer [Halomonas halophila]
MKWLHRLSLGRKFALTLIVPLVVLTTFALMGGLERQRTMSDMSRLETLAELASRAGALVHQLQRERGMSAGYLGSEGASFGDALHEQRRATDERLEAFRAAFASVDADTLGERIGRRFGEARDALGRLDRQRRSITDMSVDTAAALGYYTGINDQLLGGVAALANTTDNGELVQRLGAFYALQEVKERAGIERALLSNAFAADAFTPALYRRYLNLLGEESAFDETFRALAPPELVAALDARNERPVVAEVMAMREAAVQRGVDGGFGLSPTVWFDRQTERIGLLNEVVRLGADDLVTLADGLGGEARRAFFGYAVGAALGLGIAIGLALLVTRSIVVPLKRTLSTIAGSQGDLTQRLDVLGSDELAQLNRAYNASTDDIERMVVNIKRGAEGVSTASGEIAQGNQDLAQRTEEQSASIVETASSMEQITATVRQTADSAAQARDLTQRLEGEAQEAGDVAGRTRDAMGEIKDSNRQVTAMVEAIDQIAFQTNLLALNASVEAARAGEHGRGFAVVADEVRKLAQRCAEQATQIRGLVDTNVANIDRGEQLVGDATERVGVIAQGVRQIAQFVSEIASASQEQSSGIEQVNQAISQLEEVTQRNAALVEQSAAASKSLDDQAEEMTELVGRFRVADAAGAERLSFRPRHDEPAVLA